MTAAPPFDALLVDPRAHADGRVDAVFQQLRAELPVSRCEPPDFPAFWSVVCYDDVRSVYADPTAFGSTGGVLLRPSALGGDPGGGLTLALSDPPRHGALRGLLTPLFDERHARSLHDTMRRDVRSVLRRAADQGEVDLAHEIGQRLSSLQIARLLGVPEVDLEQVCCWIGESFAAGRPMTSHQALASYVIDMIYDRMERPLFDVIGRLVDGEPEGEPLSETEILLNVENILGASENAGLSLAAGFLGLLEHPSELSRLREDPRWVQPACEEVLRWASSASHSMRTARHDTVLSGVPIRKGDLVVVWVRSANRDDTVFESPRSFKIDRSPNRHLALGTGEHVCIGQSVARHQMRVVLESLRTEVASIEATGEVRWIESIAVSGPAELPVRIRMR